MISLSYGRRGKNGHGGNSLQRVRQYQGAFLAAPCKTACPQHIPAQAIVQKIAKEDFRSLTLLTERGALQSICSLVCTHPCQDACVRGKSGRGVSIRELERFILAEAKRRGWDSGTVCAADNGHRASVVGSGPAGLAVPPLSARRMGS
jgi:NADPH-dependent glutamate synthase beta subunit-like oxidoreductase